MGALPPEAPPSAWVGPSHPLRVRHHSQEAQHPAHTAAMFPSCSYTASEKWEPLFVVPNEDGEHMCLEGHL